MVEIPKLTCGQCNHTWTPTKEDPVVCPRCKSYKWKDKREESTKASS